ncbi:MAG: carotenoid 1,2-hydratase [Planctomycetes bacterium]|nr:carotenoid 1,2-hydratase [Planctomycetota bacterium]
MTMRTCIALLAVALAACGRDPRRSGPAPLAVQDVLGGGAAPGFLRATEPPQLVFPRDHGAHRGFRTEWWYVTGNVDAANGRRFGVQLVFFRQGLAAAAEPRTATLAAHELVLAHAAVTDVDGGRHHYAERLARAAAGLGEVVGPDEREPFRAVCADWSMRAVPGGDGFLPLELRAGDGGAFAFTLRLDAGKPIVLQGDRGLSQKGSERGNASIYYSLTRAPLTGTIEVDGVRHEVRGLGWLDREWSTSALAADQVGWDWFSLQLDDGTDVMWYQLRRRDDTVDPWSRGCLVAADGTVTRLEPARMAATPQGTWAAADGLARYPARFRLVSTAPAFDLEVLPLVADQELQVAVRYWEGAVAVRGTRDGRPVQGRGYLELTGYTLPR